MTREKIMVDLFDFSPPTYYRWTKHEKRKIFDLLDYAFTNEELERSERMYKSLSNNTFYNPKYTYPTIIRTITADSCLND